MPEIVREKAPAKINPYLRILGKRRDGYHEIETLILPISLEDSVAVEARAGGFGVRVTGPLADHVPGGEDNLAMRAARALASAVGFEGGADILVDKHVPVAAGLGGGSSDAAAVLRGLNRLWKLGLPIGRLAEIGAAVGSDVPALVHGVPVIARGRGEIVEPVDIPRTFWLLITPDIEIPAGLAYSWSSAIGRLFRRTPPLARLVEVLRAGDVEEAGTLVHNDLARGVRRRHPQVADAERDLLRGGPGHRAVSVVPGSRRGAIGAVMSGSGPSVAGLFAGRDESGLFSTVLRATPVETLPAMPSERLG